MVKSGEVQVLFIFVAVCICGLLMISVTQLYSMEWQDNEWIINREGYRRMYKNLSGGTEIATQNQKSGPLVLRLGCEPSTSQIWSASFEVGLWT